MHHWCIITQLFTLAAVSTVVGDLTKQAKKTHNDSLKKRSGIQHFDIIFTFYNPIQLKLCPSIAVQDPKKGETVTIWPGKVNCS